jgi:hypothetical protein
MNKIVKEHYPASQLPEDLRVGVDPEATVTITIVEEEATSPQKVVSLEEIWALRTPPFKTAEQIDDDLRRQRDEWDD